MMSLWLKRENYKVAILGYSYRVLGLFVCFNGQNIPISLNHFLVGLNVVIGSRVGSKGGQNGCVQLRLPVPLKFLSGFPDYKK